MNEIKGNIVDVVNERIFSGIIKIKDRKIKEIKRTEDSFEHFIIPGLVDAHIHIESSMLSPIRFAEAVLPHGTVAVVSDPHEIANVLGIKGVLYMIAEAEKTPLKAFFTAPSCVPATKFETSGAVLGAREIERLMKHDKIVALGEVMNFPGVINRSEEVMKKIEIAKKYGKPIDGHCPGLSGNDLKKYVSAGITTDHECTTLEEAREKAKLGMKIMIREGSSAKNMKALVGLAKEGYECFLVSDDKHTNDLINGHVNLLLRRAVSLGLEPIKAIKAVTLNPIEHYNLLVGLLRVNDPADFVVIDNLNDFNVIETWVNGRLVAKNGKCLFKAKPRKLKSTMRLRKMHAKDFEIFSRRKRVRVIKIVKDQIVTKATTALLKTRNNLLKTDIKRDILKIAVVERYGHNRIALGFVKGFSLKSGAIASSVAHDSHNIIVVGEKEDDMAIAVNQVKRMKGGLVCVKNGRVISIVELPIAGLMSNQNAKNLSKKLERIHESARSIGCKLKSPFMTLSFLALLVIPELKISDYGLFDVNKFGLVDLVV
ncbi:MAG: adenine deaminase [Candidatus Aenigmatarchaeota archaeon]